MIVMIIITILMLIGIDKSPICPLCCFASYSATLMEGWNNFGPTPSPPSLSLSVFVPYNFNFGSKDQRYKKEGPDPNKGSTQLYVEISNKRSKVDFTVGNTYFLLPISMRARPSFFRILHTVIRLS